MNDAPESGRRTDRRRRLVVGLVLAVVVALASEFHLRDQVPSPPLPKPNGFHALMAATRIMTEAPRFYQETPLEQLRALVETNAAAIQLLQEGFRRQSRIIYPFNADYIDARMGEIKRTRQMTQVLAAGSWIAASDGRHVEAIDHALSAVRLGHEGFRGGVMIDRLVGFGCESVGLARLEPLTNVLAAADCRRVASALEAVDTNRETMEQVLENEKEWTRCAVPWRHKLQIMWELKSFNPDKLTREAFVNDCITSDRRRREIILLFAARAYELEHGQPPLRAAVLVPEYLRALPQDPETGTPMELPRVPK
jgi:hypothetical protein